MANKSVTTVERHTETLTNLVMEHVKQYDDGGISLASLRSLMYGSVAAQLSITYDLAYTSGLTEADGEDFLDDDEYEITMEDDIDDGEDEDPI